MSHKNRKITGVVLAILLAAGIGIAAAAIYLWNNMIGSVTYEKEKTEEEKTKEEKTEEEKTEEEKMKEERSEKEAGIGNEEYHILLTGIDSREKGGSGRSDSMILLSVNEKEKRILATSILRDIYVEIPGYGGNRLNAAYVFGGVPLLRDTLRQNLGVEAEKYIMVDFFAFAEVIDLLGGVDIEVSEEEIPVLNRYVKELNRLEGGEDSLLLSKPGKQKLDGRQALAYARIRYIGNGDFDRTKRQRRILDEVFQKTKDANFMETYRLSKAVLSKVTTNLDKEELWTLIKRFPQYKEYQTDQWSIPMEGTYSNTTVKGMAVLSIDFEANKKELKRRIGGGN